MGENLQFNSEQLQQVDDLLDRFDDSWHRQQIPNIAEFLFSGEDANNLLLLIELIKIDLEYRWRTQATVSMAPQTQLPWFSLLRDYQRCFPKLGNDCDLPLDLIVEEYRVRRRWGDRPSHYIYTLQYGPRHPDIESALSAVDKELQPPDDSPLQGSPQQSHICDLSLPAFDKSSPTDLQVGDEIGDFRLLNRLGSGSFAEVFLAQQKSMQRLVALKVSLVRSHEPKVLSSLDHPNIVRVYDQRQVGKLYFLLMQYVSGGSLREIIERMPSDNIDVYSGQMFLQAACQTVEDQGHVPTLTRRQTSVSSMNWGTTVTWLGARLASALQHAHSQGVQHRDIKPENILVTAEGQPLLVDFNLSFGQSIEGANAQDFFGGSLAYMSPQQLKVLLNECSPEEVDPTSDFYSLAIMLWELLVGKRPFPDDPEEETTQSTLKNMLARRLAGPNLADLPEHCPGGLKEMLVEHLGASDSGTIRSTTGTVRRLHLALSSEVDRLLTPGSDKWTTRWALRPTLWILLGGLLPNVLISLLNIWANHQLTLQNFDRKFFVATQQPVINAITFALGISAGLWAFGPVIKAMWALQSQPFDRQAVGKTIATRCLTAPQILVGVILALWVGSGVAFPLWNQASPLSQVGTADFFVFVGSQILHGIIAASTTFVFVSLITVKAFYPCFLPEHEDRHAQRQLNRLGQQLDWATSCLGLTPLLAILVLSLADQMVEKRVFIALAVVGFLCYLLSSTVTPKIHKTLDWLKLSLAPIEELLPTNSPDQ
jgi:serine/threonine protein kinase